MMTTELHIVRPGDWLGAIAERYGLGHWSVLWDHPANARLRELRQSPDLIMVGDEVAVPASDQGRGIAVATGQRVVFRIRGPDVVRLRLVGIEAFVQHMGAVAWTADLDGRISEGTIEPGQALIEVALHAGASKLKLSIEGQPVGEFDVGGLGPVSEGKGAFARLVNLGFVESDRDQAAQEQVVDPLADALTRFQRRYGLERTGELDEATQKALADAYGT